MSHLDRFSWVVEKQGRVKNKGIKSFHIWYLWVSTKFSAESKRNLWFGKFSNLKLNTRLPRKRIWKLQQTLILLLRREKDLSSKFTLLSIAETSLDRSVAMWHMCTYWNKQNVSSKIWLCIQRLPDTPSLSPHICQSMRYFFYYFIFKFISNFQFMCRAKFSAFG